MSVLDSRTTLVLAAILFLLLPALLWWTTAAHRERAVYWWCAGSLLASTGIVLMALRPSIPAWASHHGGNTCLLVSTILWSQSLRLRRGRPWTPAQVALGVIAAALFYSTLYAGFEPNARGVGMRLALGALCLYTAWQAGMLGRELRSQNAMAIALGYLVLGLALWSQLLLHGGGGDQPNPFSRTWDASLLAVVVLITAATAHLCLAGIVLDDSANRQARARLAQSAMQETTQFDTRLRQLDHEGRLVLAAGALAHELHQPLTAALTQAQMAQRRLARPPADPGVLAESLSKVDAAVSRAAGIVERIRASARASAPTVSAIDLHQVITESIELFQGEWNALGVVLDWQRGPGPLRCQGDPIALSQVVVNLLRNATQAASAGPDRRLRLEGVAEGDTIRLTLRDHGPGVPPDVIGRIGDPFVGRRERGLGLGLAISQVIMQQHGGQLVLRNPADGGAEAILLLPRAGAKTP